jgi:hypothetical protein
MVRWRERLAETARAGARSLEEHVCVGVHRNVVVGPRQARGPSARGPHTRGRQGRRRSGRGGGQCSSRYPAGGWRGEARFKLGQAPLDLPGRGVAEQPAEDRAGGTEALSRSGRVGEQRFEGI